MKPLTLEWIDKAEGDYTSARRELRARKTPNYGYTADKDMAYKSVEICRSVRKAARLSLGLLP